jgi:transposase
MAAHYGTVIMPARPRKPRDRAKVESAVQVVERWVLAPLRHRTFFSLAELNQELAVLRDRLNDTPFQKLPGTRRTLFETLERPALRPLPPQRYELAQWRKARVNIDYHCEIDRGYYSVPHQLVHEVVDVRLTMSTVELFYKGRRVASHLRCTDLGQYRTNPEHRPASHRKHLEWTPSRLVRWAETSGAHTGALVSALLAAKPHPEQGYRARLGFIRLGKRYSAERLDAACQPALVVGAISYRSVKSILEAGPTTPRAPPRPHTLARRRQGRTLRRALENGPPECPRSDLRRVGRHQDTPRLRPNRPTTQPAPAGRLLPHRRR